MNQSPWFDAIIEPSALLILVASVIAGLLAAWWLFPVGLLLWLFIFLRILLDPSARLNQVVSGRVELAQRFQAPFGRIQKIQVNIFNTINGSPRGTRGKLLPLSAAVNQLMDQLYELCKRMSPLENLRVTSTPQASLQQDLDKTNAQIAAAGDPASKQALQETAKSIQSRLQEIIDISQRLDRFDAQLTNLENELQSILTEAVKLQSSAPANIASDVKGTVERVKNEAEQLKSFS